MSRADGNIVKCEDCGQTLIAEHLANHKCNPPTKHTQIREIPIKYYFKMESEDGNPVIYARSYGDIVYWLEVMPEAKSRLVTAIKRPEDETEPLRRLCQTYGTRFRLSNVGTQWMLFTLSTVLRTNFWSRVK